MEQNYAEELGLSTSEALNKLYVEIESVLLQFKYSQKSRKSKNLAWIRDALSLKSKNTTIDWIAAGFQLWTSLALVLGYCLDGDNVELYEAFIIFVLLILNISIELYNNKLRHNEIPNRVEMVLDKLKREMNHINWKPENYANLYTPLSPCITLQWTYRDGHLIHLPWALLVKDDIILVKPGQICPGYCEALDKQTEHQILHAKEIYSPSLQNANEIFSAPKSKKPLEAKKYRLLETPYLYNLKISLEEALDRPVTQHNQQRHFVMVKVIEYIVLPVMFLLVFSANVFRYLYFQQYLGHYSIANMFFISPSNAILPLLPIVFPLVWNVSNCIGMARFKAIFDASRLFRPKYNPLEEDTDTTNEYNEDLKCSWKEIYKNFIDICKGNPEILCRSENILHVLGSVSALGCVDKKGILSWPNPTAEKVFFLHNRDQDTDSSETSLVNVNDLATDQSTETTGNINFDADSPLSATPEVLDLTHNHSEPFRLHFDDHNWQKYLSSLKPLGLGILLNTCNLDTQDRYSHFCSHITCEAMYNENLVPVTNRRCLCELAKEIGFLDQAQKIFNLEQQLSVFRHLQPEMVRRDNKYARTLQLSTRLKFPFPHAFAVVVKELCSGNMQLLSEGTADIILDCCMDYWDGADLCPLSHSDRKKIQDFYQRSSLTAYCTAFAYRPLSKSVSDSLSEVYLELPSDSRHLYMTHRSPTPVHWDCKSVLDPKIRNTQFFSTDSLLYNDYPVGNNISDTESCFQMQCNQIFIGMVTMQYQALTDMVQLIEQLERACIRFVHFSKENELRSRVFSEKMGLESGWNCHISLLSDRNSNLESSRTMSFSAPSAINMEHSVVKFDTEVEKFHVARRQSENHEDTTSQDSVPVHADSTTHDWQSLSCLTDSTEHSAPINFDMSNRAKLPRGIDKIRPHIELIDNVPLLVSLFTDCTPTATREMLRIMQDYHEVVCILGSSQNCDNAGIFMQADASISVEPLYPQVCQKIEVYKKAEGFSPTDLSCLLNSIACALTINRADPISIYHLIMEARNFGATLWSSVQFWLCCCVVLSLMQVSAVVLMLPELLTTGHNLWLAGVVVPVISMALSMNPVDPDVMKKPIGKSQALFRWDTAVFIFWCYGLKFLPTVVTVLICYAGILTSHCNQMCSEPFTELGPCRCVFFYNPTGYRNITDGDDVGGFEEGSWTLMTARLIVIFIVLLHFVVISVGFVHRDRLCYRKFPHSNLVWLVTIFTLVFLQSLYLIFTYRLFVQTLPDNEKFDMPLWVILFGALSPIFVFLINEVVKKQEIMVNKRFLKRARLDFGTKLGMNSPF
ncbi:transmembrane protein 94 isoform X2 [Sitophilus oryzae]|uniref:Transmembrane protein 94 isoform X2 n=1 Tax=Sitophilus oryzae TaxID=7048 RepID=A0A6J2XB39_SITOR|nr:transmembrane protein 94 isoform X2 [Sitophilus oryzae]